MGKFIEKILTHIRIHIYISLAHVIIHVIKHAILYITAYSIIKRNSRLKLTLLQFTKCLHTHLCSASTEATILMGSWTLTRLQWEHNAEEIAKREIERKKIAFY